MTCKWHDGGSPNLMKLCFARDKRMVVTPWFDTCIYLFQAWNFSFFSMTGRTKKFKKKHCLSYSLRFLRPSRRNSSLNFALSQRVYFPFRGGTWTTVWKYQYCITVCRNGTRKVRDVDGNRFSVTVTDEYEFSVTATDGGGVFVSDAFPCKWHDRCSSNLWKRYFIRSFR